jgi:hypothetical protein
MGSVVDPASIRLHELTGRHDRGMTEYGDQVALAAGFDTQHAKPVLSVVEVTRSTTPARASIGALAFIAGAIG